MTRRNEHRSGSGLAKALTLALIAWATAFAAPCAAEASDQGAAAGRSVYVTRSRVDWKARVLSIDVELDLAAAGLRLPEGRLEAQRMLERDLAALAKDAVFALQADSYRSIEDAVADGSFDPEALVALANLAVPERSSLSKDMGKFLETYNLKLDAVASLFLSGATPAPIRAPLESRPTRDYTGIVIFAKGKLPLHGEAAEGVASPCLFPRVYDAEMNVVLDKSVVLPEALAEGGVLGYASGLGVAAGERVGTDPMRVMAVELFGDRSTDFVISRDDALRILSSAANRELLREGKVVVVY